MIIVCGINDFWNGWSVHKMKKSKISFEDRMKSHAFADDELKCHHIHCEMRFSEVLGRESEYCLKCKNFIWK